MTQLSFKTTVTALLDMVLYGKKVGRYDHTETEHPVLTNSRDWMKKIQVNLDSTKVKLLLSYKLTKYINKLTKERDGKSFPSSQSTHIHTHQGKHIQQQQRHGTSVPSVLFCV